MRKGYTDIGLKVRDVLGVETESGAPRFQLGDLVLGKGEWNKAPFWGTDGFAAAPNPDDKEGTCSIISLPLGNEEQILGSIDRRYVTKTGTLEPGDRMIYSRGEARLVLKAATDVLVLYTARKSDGTAIVSSVDAENGTASMTVGLTAVEVSEEQILLSINGGPAITLAKDPLTGQKTIVLTADQINVDGGLVTVGLLPGGIRPALIPLQSGLRGPSGLLGVPSSSVLLG